LEVMLGSVLNCGVRRSEFRFLPFHRRHKRPPRGRFVLLGAKRVDA